MFNIFQSEALKNFPKLGFLVFITNHLATLWKDGNNSSFQLCNDFKAKSFYQLKKKKLAPKKISSNVHRYVSWSQGDQTGRIFAYWGDCLFLAFFKLQMLAKFHGNFLKLLKLYLCYFFKMSWAAFWAILSETHLVTLNTKPCESGCTSVRRYRPKCSPKFIHM
jgi:hypothetical protein